MIGDLINRDSDIRKVVLKNRSAPFTNCYIVLDGDDALVVDTGSPDAENGDLFASAIAELAAEGRTVSFFITHLHIDHVGLLPALLPEGSRVYVGREELAALEDSRSPDCRRGMLGRILAMGFQAGEAEQCMQFAFPLVGKALSDCDVSAVEDGDLIRVGNHGLRAILTPGHTPGHICLYDQRSGLMFTGDHVLMETTPYICVSYDGTDLLEGYMDSLQALEATGCERGLPGHGKADGSLAERMEWLAGHRRQRLDEVRFAVIEEPESSTVEIVRALRWKLDLERWRKICLYRRWVIVSDVQACLDHLQAEGEVSCERDSEGVDRYRAE